MMNISVLNKYRGFTLLETMVAVSVIAIVLVSIYQLHIRTISMNIDAKFYAVAPLLAQQKLAEMELSPLSEASDDSGDFGENFPGYTYKIQVGNIKSDLLGSVMEDIKQIDINIGFNSDEFTYHVRVYRLDRR
jgi:general secretion pathway protein I